MQNRLPLTLNNPLNSVTGLARQIALPGEHAPLRYPSFPALERTAVMGFNAPATLALKTNADTAITVFRSGVYPVWADQGLEYLSLATYRTQQSIAGAGLTGTQVEEHYPIQNNIIEWTVANRPASSTQLGLTSTGTPMATIPWPIFGRDAGLPGPEFLYCPGAVDGAAYVVIYSDVLVPQATTASIEMEEWLSPGQSKNFNISATLDGTNRGALGTIIPCVTGRWFRPISVSYGANASGSVPYRFMVALVASTLTPDTPTFYTKSATTAGSLGFSPGTYPIGAPSTHLPLAIPNEFNNSILPWYATRVTAAALLGTNVTQVLNKAGTVLGGRLSPAVINPWNATTATVQQLHPAEKAFLALETGVYTYCPPSTDLIFFTDYTLNTGGGAANAPTFALHNDAMYNKIFINNPAASDASLACTCTWHIEFRTSSSLFQIGLSNMTLESLHQAQIVLAENGFFFENPTHERVLNKIINTAKRVVPMAVSAYNPVAGAILSKAVQTTRLRSGPSKPPTTSASASGIIPRPTRQNSRRKPKPKAKQRR